MLFEKGSNGFLGALIVLSAIGFFWGWGPLKGLHEHWTGEAKKPVITEAESRWRASREEAQRKAKEAEEQARREDQITLTMGNFEAKLRDHLKGTYYTISRIGCGADHFNPGGTHCSYQFNIGKNGSMLFIKSGPGSRRLNYVGLMVANPALYEEPDRSEIRRFYELLAERVASLVVPEVGLDKSLLKKLRSGLGPANKEVIVTIGQWEYIAGSGPLDWGFHVKQK
jgi:hypothetical protein